MARSASCMSSRGVKESFAVPEPLEKLSGSLAGNPEDTISIDGRNYTFTLLYYYLRYAYTARFFPYSNAPVIVELGSGSGRQAEIIAKLHPQACIVLFDLAPQLYVCHQYLKAVFGGAIVDYRESRELPRLEAVPGRIYLLGTAQFPRIAEFPRVDLFWNAASMQEMEPRVVENYLSIVRVTASAVYLMEHMGGKEKAQKAGDAGVLEQVTLEHYKRGLYGFDLLDLSRAIVPTGDFNDVASDSFWRRCPAATDPH